MRLLAISDVPERLLYDDFQPDEWRDRVDLVISCGDLDPEYLEFLVTELNVPLLYVAGNHDTSYRARPPEGCEDIDGRVVTVGRLRIAGMSGSMRYNAGPEAYQYTERQMARRMRRLGWRIRWAGGLDVMVTHAAPLFGDPLLDAHDIPHRGFGAFQGVLARYRPRYWLHGHNHLIFNWVPRVKRIDATLVINAYGHYEIDTDNPPRPLPIVADPSSILRPT